jgi:hypothetical protein
MSAYAPNVDMIGPNANGSDAPGRDSCTAKSCAKVERAEFSSPRHPPIFFYDDSSDNSLPTMCCKALAAVASLSRAARLVFDKVVVRRPCLRSFCGLPSISSPAPETEQALGVTVRDLLLIIHVDGHLIKALPSGFYAGVWPVRGEHDAVDADRIHHVRLAASIQSQSMRAAAAILALSPQARRSISRPRIIARTRVARASALAWLT